MEAQREYQSPVLVVIGSVADFTEAINKDFGTADPGFTFQNQTTSVIP